MIFSAEHLLLFAIVLIIFGPKTLPAMGSVLGKTARNLKDGLAGVKEPDFKKISETIIGPGEKKND